MFSLNWWAVGGQVSPVVRFVSHPLKINPCFSFSSVLVYFYFHSFFFWGGEGGLFVLSRLRQEVLGGVLDVVLSKGGDEEVGMVVVLFM